MSNFIELHRKHIATCSYVRDIPFHRRSWQSQIITKNNLLTLSAFNFDNINDHRFINVSWIFVIYNNDKKEKLINTYKMLQSELINCNSTDNIKTISTIVKFRDNTFKSYTGSFQDTISYYGIKYCIDGKNKISLPYIQHTKNKKRIQISPYMITGIINSLYHDKEYLKSCTTNLALYIITGDYDKIKNHIYVEHNILQNLINNSLIEKYKFDTISEAVIPTFPANVLKQYNLEVYNHIVEEIIFYLNMKGVISKRTIIKETII